MNHYEQHQEQRRAGLLRRASRLEAEADELDRQTSAMAEVMNGQPILIGHHSERRHRRDLERLHAKMRRAHELRQQAEECRRRAEAVGTAGVSSDDPDAIAKLRAELAELEGRRDRLKRFNRQLAAAYRRHLQEQEAQGIERIHAFGFAARQAVKEVRAELDEEGRAAFDAAAKDLRIPEWSGAPAPKFLLRSEKIRRLKERIEELERRDTTPPQELRGEGWRIYDDTADNRTCVEFDAIPAEETRQRLRSFGFRWSRSNRRWQRHRSPAAFEAAKVAVTGAPTC